MFHWQLTEKKNITAKFRPALWNTLTWAQCCMNEKHAQANEMIEINNEMRKTNETKGKMEKKNQTNAMFFFCVHIHSIQRRDDDVMKASTVLFLFGWLL